MDLNKIADKVFWKTTKPLLSDKGINIVLSINDMQLHSHACTHANIYLGVLLLHVQNLVWWVKCISTLKQVCSVILLQIIHLQLPLKHQFYKFGNILHFFAIQWNISNPCIFLPILNFMLITRHNIMAHNL